MKISKFAEAYVMPIAFQAVWLLKSFFYFFNVCLFSHFDCYGNQANKAVGQKHKPDRGLSKELSHKRFVIANTCVSALFMQQEPIL